ncbi:hypothetical protein EDB81DRAFT_860540 [Dactylonectria macrodidyma]|uniref:DUF7053 domain-containing protein n=1 Tax=Dactylonectria macrodidyma TaxID=307937 RepID=A0A9P9IMI6_9HYPO|nr:hypothetical protein EDB81DRAFT_860540 [Dactylonectria macrodidyma]
MRSQYHVSMSVPIPGNLPPEVVLDLLQTFAPTLEHNPIIADFTEIDTDMDSITKDPFFDPLNESIRTYKTHQVFTLVPGVTKQMWWPTTFHWTVRPRQDAASPSTPGTEQTLVEEWELYEEIILEANKLLLPFCCPILENVHREINVKVVDQAMKSYTSRIPKHDGT